MIGVFLLIVTHVLRIGALGLGNCIATVLFEADLCDTLYCAMLELRTLMRFLDISFILRLLYIVLLCSLIPIGDMGALLELSEILPKYALLAAVTASGLLGLLLSFLAIRGVLRNMNAKIKEGYYPRIEFFELLGLLPAAFLLITPGFLGDLLGLILLMPTFRRNLGKALAGQTEERFKELYEYLKLYEL